MSHIFAQFGSMVPLRLEWFFAQEGGRQFEQIRLLFAGGEVSQQAAIVIEPHDGSQWLKERLEKAGFRCVRIATITRKQPCEPNSRRSRKRPRRPA